ncbi:MAG: hypothetical protein VYD64_01490 [Pseudomonadota bacterium]|nr:hypothetical protein [Pseudomonadota bacterium]
MAIPRNHAAVAGRYQRDNRLTENGMSLETLDVPGLIDRVPNFSLK